MNGNKYIGLQNPLTFVPYKGYPLKSINKRTLICSFYTLVQLTVGFTKHSV